MGETGIVRFQGNLDPRAQEYIPARNLTHHAVILFRPPPPPPPPQVFFPYLAPAAVAEFQVVPFAAAAVEHFPAAATRAVALSGVPREASETSVRRELEAFGDVRAVQMERLRSDAIVTVHFYDLRSAESALAEIRLRHHYAAASPFLLPPPLGLLSGPGVWAQFVVPAGNAVPEGHNQGTIVIFNLDDKVTASTLRDIFNPFGAIKDLRETPAKKHQKFVEFFDVRDAAKALKEMNGKDIHGKPVVIEFSRPGGHCRKSLVNAALTGRISAATKASPPQPLNKNNVIIPYSHSTNNFARSSSSNHAKFFTPPPPRKLTDHVDKFPARKPNFFVRNWNKNRTASAATTSVERSDKTAGSSSSSSGHCNGTSETTTTTTTSSSFSKKSASPPTATATAKSTVQGRSTRTKKSKHGKKLDSRFLISEESMTESSSCKDTRTTVMIKNIPNKYSQKLLLNMLDNHCIHCNKRIADGGGDEDRDQPYSSYDFVYLPIDFNNKCNVGYGFVNMTSPEATWRLYKAFHRQLWEAFNSRKICEVTYARVQGLEALKEHFKNSKFPCEMDHYLPVYFSPPRDGRQLTEPLPIVGSPTITHPTLTASTSPSSSVGGGNGSASNDVDGRYLLQNGGVAIGEGIDGEDDESRD